jgi:branched-chain amino acid transport system ATP-binding protein
MQDKLMLKVENLFAGYARVQVLKDINMEVKGGEIVCLVGANGAGKSTLLKVISGIIPARQGKITMNGQEISNQKPDQIVRMGLCHVPEGRQIFGDLTVRQNLMLGSYVHKLKKDEMEKLFYNVFGLFPILKKRFAQKAGTMSGGEQQMLAIGRGLMSQPKILLLDEPSLGLAPMVVKAILGVIQNLRSASIAILLVEQNVDAALHIADRAYVIETGTIATQGNAQELMENDEIRRSYLGM